MSCAKKAEKIVLITNTKKDTDLSLYKEIIALAHSYGVEVRTPEAYREQCFDARVKYMPDECVYEGADAAVVLGGDGTILKAATGAVRSGCPILGVNLGRVGYMAEVGKDEIALIKKLFEGDYRISERMTLTVWLEDGGVRVAIYENALNDVAIHSDKIGRVLDLEISSGGSPVAELRGDGVVISTPTGSTAYSMSAGGPVLDPSLECICITPISSLSPAARPMVFSAEHELKIKKGCSSSNGLFVCCDGNEGMGVCADARIIIKRSETKARLISLGEEQFFSVYRKKIISAM